MTPVSRKITLSLMLILALLATSIVGCPNNDTDTTDAPVIPPMTTFVMNFDDFNDAAEAASATLNTGTSFQFAGLTMDGDNPYPSGQYAAGNQSNWGWAALNVGVWSALVLIGSAVPIATFAASFSDTPELLEDNTWEWYYTVPVTGPGGVTIYTAKLHGRFIDDYPSVLSGTDPGVRWEMYISQEGEFTDFLWYYGESKLPANEGFWILKDNPTDQTDLVRIDWTSTDDDTYSIQYTNIVPDGPENGGYISFEATTDDPYDRYYHIYNKGKDNLIQIEWNSTTGEGRIQDEDHFGNGAWWYWCEYHQNKDA